ncbi:uncharacterized protein LOC128552344 [Mercenaria mercenaria]|uniref:uncharacterized protein LOC128552344 n=1 Tax=Mercenaria mercenaria TaxID=6596 RepID=UPI00234F0A1D|nr:uncharacterized protein LOC128552344 [Mercenaria mercenaria]
MENSSFEDGIECPICRQTTRILEQGKSPKELSKSLPLNYTILPLLETLTLDDSTTDPVCMSCRDNCTTCFAICENCSGIVCPVCDELHEKLLIFKNHKIVRIGGSHMTICVKHQNKGLDYYCQDHEEILCSTCAVVDHRSCSKIHELKDIATSDRLQDKSMSIKKDLRLLQSSVSEKIHQILSSHDTVKISCAETDTQDEKIEKSFAEYKRKKESYLEKCEEKAKECLLACQKLSGKR